MKEGLGPYDLNSFVHILKGNSSAMHHIKDDCELIKMLGMGSQEAFVDLYNKYKHGVYHNITKIIQDPVLAQDIMQEVFLTLWNKRNNIASIKAVGSWLFVISYNKSVDHLKKRLKENKLVALMADCPDDILEDTLSSQEKEEDYEHRIWLLNNAIEQLPGQKKKVFKLFRLEGKTHEEIAAITGISIQSVKDYLKQCTAILRKHLNENSGNISAESQLFLLFLVSGYLLQGHLS